MVRGTRFLVAAFGLLAACSPAWSDEGLWLFTQPPQLQLKEKYAFELTDTLLERLQKASVMVGSASGSFVSPDGLVLTNRHVGLQWVQELSENGADLVRDGFYADQRGKELRCTGLELRVLSSMHDVTARVDEAIKPDMTLAEASKARDLVLRAIEEESRMKTSLVSEIVALNHGGRYHLYRYKKYTDVRLVFVPEASIGSMVDICFFRAYEHGQPAKSTDYLAWSPTAPERGELVFVSGHPGATHRFCTSADLESRYGPLYFLRYKGISRWKNALADFAKGHPDRERHTGFEALLLTAQIDSVLSELYWQEKLLRQVRVREQTHQSLLLKKDLETAKRHQQALARIDICLRENAELGQAHFFLESANAFQSHLFHYARCLVRLADESAKPTGERLLQYSRSECRDMKRFLLEPRTVVKEMEVVKLAESLDFWARYAGADGALADKVLDGKTPKELARALIEGTTLDRVEVRKAVVNGGPKAVADSQDPMLAVARLVDARSRQVRQDWAERVLEPCRQAYAVLARIQEQAPGGAVYPDATGTLRLSFGKVLPYADAQIALRLADVFDYPYETQLPTKWWAARSQVDMEALLLFRCSADGAPGNSGSPVVDRQGRLVGVAAWGDQVSHLAYLDDNWGCGAVAAQGILEILDKVYHAGALVKELGGNKQVPRKLVLPPFVPQPVNPAMAAPSISPPRDSYPSPSGSSASGVTPSSAIELPEPDSAPALSSSPSPSVGYPFKPSSQFSINPFPPPDVLLRPETEEPPTIAPAKAPSLVERHKELTPALIKALKDADAEVRQTAETALASLGGDALPALIEALRAKESRRPGAVLIRDRFDSGSAAGKLGNDGPNAIPTLVRALEDDDVEVRRRAVRALAAVVRERRQTDSPPPCHP